MYFSTIDVTRLLCCKWQRVVIMGASYRESSNPEKSVNVKRLKCCNMEMEEVGPLIIPYAKEISIGNYRYNSGFILVPVSR